MRSIILEITLSVRSNSPVVRLVCRSMSKDGLSITALADWNAAGNRTVSRNISATSSANASLLCSWMNPSWGIAPTAATAITAAEVTATDA